MSLPNASPTPRQPGKVIPLPGVRPPRRHLVRRVLRIMRRTIVILVALSLLMTVSLNWWTPPRTSYMVQSGGPVTYQYVSLDHISRFMVAATVVHEDDQLGTRFGAFDWDAFWARAQAYGAGEKDPSGSTIPQQLVKNIYLWPAHDWLRKGIEAGLSEEVAFMVPKRRIVELYLNYAQFGPKLYGICAASWYYFNTPPARMTQYQAAQLMGVLPDPERVKRAKDGGIDLGPTADKMAVDLVNGAANVWVPRQLEQAGGWQAVNKSVGITDTASDYEHRMGEPDSCDTMPKDVLWQIATDTTQPKPAT